MSAMRIRAEQDGALWVIRTVDANGFTWFRRIYKTPRGALRAVKRLESQHTISDQERTMIEQAAEREST